MTIARCEVPPVSTMQNTGAHWFFGCLGISGQHLMDTTWKGSALCLLTKAKTQQQIELAGAKPTCVKTDLVCFGSLSAWSSWPTATQTNISLKEALEVAAITSPVSKLFMSTACRNAFLGHHHIVTALRQIEQNTGYCSNHVASQQALIVNCTHK